MDSLEKFTEAARELLNRLQTQLNATRTDADNGRPFDEYEPEAENDSYIEDNVERLQAAAVELVVETRKECGCGKCRAILEEGKYPHGTFTPPSNPQSDIDAEVERLIYQTLSNGMAAVLDYNGTPRIKHVQEQALKDINAMATDMAKWRLSEFVALLRRRERGDMKAVVSLLETTRQLLMGNDGRDWAQRCQDTDKALEKIIAQLKAEEQDKSS